MAAFRSVVFKTGTQGGEDGHRLRTLLYNLLFQESWRVGGGGMGETAEEREKSNSPIWYLFINYLTDKHNSRQVKI